MLLFAAKPRNKREQLVLVLEGLEQAVDEVSSAEEKKQLQEAAASIRAQ